MITKRPFKFPYLMVPAAVAGVLCVCLSFAYQGLVWYSQELLLPPLTPPEWMFLVTGTSIAILIGSLLITILTSWKQDMLFWSVAILLFINGLTVALWAFVFFALHKIEIAWWLMTVLTTTVLILIPLVWKRSQHGALLLLPYAIWLLFVLHLHYEIWLINEAL